MPIDRCVDVLVLKSIINLFISDCVGGVEIIAKLHIILVRRTFLSNNIDIDEDYNITDNFL